MAIRKTIDIDINTNADEAAKEFDNLSKSTKVANDSLEGLNKTFEEANGDIQPLTARMGEAEDRLYELAAAGDTASTEYQGLLNKVGEYRKVQIQTDLAVDNAAGTLGQKLGGALTGAASGFAAVQGVMALTGGESEALEKSLLKVQGAMAFQQGIQGVLEFSKSIGLAGKATKVFNLIVKANPLAIIATVIIAVIGYFAIFTDAIDIAVQGLKDFGDAIGLTNFAEQELAKEQKQRNVEQMQRLNAEKSLREEQIKLLEAQGKSTIKLRRQQIEADIAAIKLQKERNDLTAQFGNALKRELGLEEEKVKQSKASIRREAQLIALEIQLINLDKEQATVNKINSDKKKEQDQKAIDDSKELARIQKEAIDTEIDEEIALQQKLDEIQRENQDRFRTEQENETLLVEEKYDTLQAMAQGNAEALEQIELARLNERNDVKLKFAEKEIEIEKDKNKKTNELDELTNTKKLQLAGASFTAIANLVGSFNTQNAKDAEKQFKIQKAFNLAAAVTNTALAVTGALTAGGNPIKLATGAQFVEAGIAAAVGAANIVQIASTQFGQGDTGGGTGDISVPTVQAPNFNVVGDSGVNQLASLQQQPTQAFVVSGDVTTAQALDRNRIQNATL